MRNSRKVNVEQVIDEAQKIQAELKAKRVRFYEIQRELYGLEIQQLMEVRPDLDMWKATQRVYNFHKLGVDPLLDDKKYYKELKKQTQVERFDNTWAQICAEVQKGIDSLS